MGTLVSWFCVDEPPAGCEQGREWGKEDLKSRAESSLPTSPMKEAGNRTDWDAFSEREGGFRGDTAHGLGSPSFSARNFSTKAEVPAASLSLTSLPQEMLSITLECSPTTSTCWVPAHLLSYSPKVPPFHKVPEHSVLKNVFLVQINGGEARALSYSSCQTWLSTELGSLK